MEFRILGPLEVLDDQRAVLLGGAKQRALLGVLLLHANEVVSTTRLVDELWGERPPATAEKLVQGYVHALRKQLGADALVTQAPGYKLRLDPRALDLLEFERLTDDARGAELPDAVALRRQALSLWRGPLLADVALEGPARHTVGRLSELRLATQIERIDAELELGRHAQLIGELESLVAANPYQERLHAQLMLALYRSGRQAEALHAYQAVRRTLSDELGLQPSQELRDLEAAILRQDESLSVDGRVVQAPPPSPTEPQKPPPPRDKSPRAFRARRLRGRFTALLVAVVGVAAAATAVLLLRDGPVPVTAPPNSVGVIDPKTNKVVDAIPVGPRPGPLAQGASIWVGNVDGKTLWRINSDTRQIVKTIQLPATPTGIAVGLGVVWIAHGRSGQLSRVDPHFDRVTKTIDLAGRALYFPNGSIDVGGGWVWAVFGNSMLARIDPAGMRLSGSRLVGQGPAGLAVGFGSVWVSNSGDSTVQRFNPITFEEGPLAEYNVGRAPRGMDVGEGVVWVVNTGDDSVIRIDPAGARSTLAIPVGDGPTAVAVGEGAVWVANRAAGTISRIDPATNKVVQTIEVGNAPSGIVVAEGLVWIAVQAP
ncbi:MAG TPA: BTAD domain-containing putative transcriptional regulator [Gaiellaceae bacterium]